MKLRPLFLAAAAALPLAGCATTRVDQAVSAPAPVSAIAPTGAAVQSEHDRLFALFAADDEASLKLSPISAIFRGDLRYADKIGNFLTPEYNEAQRKLAQDDLVELHEIDRSKLNPTDRIAYDVFEYNEREALKALSPEILALTEVRPINHFSGFHTFYPTFSSGKGAAPYKTVEDYENGISRNRNYIELIDRSIAKFREGMKSGIVESSLTTCNVIQQLDTQLSMDVEASPYWSPIKAFPADFSDADKSRLTEEYRSSIKDIYAANVRLRDFLRDEYMPVARKTVGLSQMKGGADLYAEMIEQTTTLPLSADYLHNLGLSEVARIKAGLEQIRKEVGFKGTLAQFFDYMRSDPAFTAKSRDELTQQYYSVGERVEGKIPEFFSVVPKAPLDIRPVPEFREKFAAGGSYEQGTPDGSRPGVFYFSAYDLPARMTWEETTMFLHEGEPGHHFQISLAQENSDLPAFMRFGGNTAYVEGWALYAETLGYPMGLYSDPYQRFGNLNDEMMRAMRLVVDTGIHAQGWSRDQAIEYMLANSGMTRTAVVAEVERYIAIPTQALAYKVGALTIQRLRDKAKAALGDKFDIREFHNQVLDTGALPLPVLEKKIDDWIASKT